MSGKQKETPYRAFKRVISWLRYVGGHIMPSHVDADANELRIIVIIRSYAAYMSPLYPHTTVWRTGVRARGYTQVGSYTK